MVDVSLKAGDNNVYFYEFTREIFEKLNPYIYAESDIALEQVAFELLKINKLTLATAESITGGQIVSSLIKKNLGASEVVLEAWLPIPTKQKKNAFAFQEKHLKDTQALAFKQHTTWQRALETSGADIAIATTGFASSVNQSEDAGLVLLQSETRTELMFIKISLLEQEKR